MQYALLLINACFACAAVWFSWHAYKRGGARVWVYVYALGISVYGLIVFGGAFFGLISESHVPVAMRWLWSAVFAYISLQITTDRRRDVEH